MHLRSRLSTAAFALMLTIGAAHAAAVRVTFGSEARYPDGKLYDVDTFGSIRAYLQKLGGEYLRRDETLSITILNIDLAGQDLTSRGPDRLRILSGGTPPKITLRYQLARAGKIVSSGEETLRDHSYLIRPGANASSDSLRYEKSMLEDWFREKFAASR